MTINSFLSIFQCTSLFCKTMCQVVAYRGLKTIKNFKTVCRKSGRGRLWEVVVYESFQCKVLTENIFGVLGRWSPTGGGRTWRFDCISPIRLYLPYQKRVDYDLNIKIYDYSANSLVSLERKECVKYLGVLIDSELSWTYHITYISTKISKSLGIRARLRHFVPSSALFNVYLSHVQPQQLGP